MTLARTRKPVEALTAADLEAYPVWEFLSDDGEETSSDDDDQGDTLDNESDDEDEDETWVTPVSSPPIPAGAMALCIAAAVRLPCGLVYPAVLFGDTFQGFAVNGVALLTTQGRVLFHVSDSPKETRAALKRLGLSRAQVMPMAFATRAPLSATGELASGEFDSGGVA